MQFMADTDCDSPVDVVFLQCSCRVLKYFCNWAERELPQMDKQTWNLVLSWTGSSKRETFILYKQISYGKIRLKIVLFFFVELPTYF